MTTTPLELVTTALDSLKTLEHAALDEEGRGGFTEVEIQTAYLSVKAVLDSLHAPLVAQAAQPKPLTAYKQGQYVDVFQATSGDWTQGYVSSIDAVSRHLHVETDRGPVTVANARRVRPQA